MFTPTARGFRLALGLLVASTISAAGLSSAQAADPPKLAGTWTWTWKDRLGESHKHVLEVEGVGSKLAAREIFDDQAPTRAANLALDGSTIKFTVVRDERRADYNGKIADADHINGTVMVTSGGQAQEFPWKAERRKNLPK